MKYALVLTAAAALILGAHIDGPAAQTNSQPGARQANTAGILHLSDQDKAAVIKAALDAKSHQSTPKEFTPAVGAPVPKTVFQHGFKPEIVSQMPALKEYWYAYLDREIVLIDALQKKVAAIIPLPPNLVSGEQEHQGAAESDSEPKRDGASSTESVPSHTSPETIR
jgi:hypothetical protein